MAGEFPPKATKIIFVARLKRKTKISPK